MNQGPKLMIFFILSKENAGIIAFICKKMSFDWVGSLKMPTFALR